MKIAALSISNFRGIREGFVKFGTHPVLVGSNNTGKTTLIEALALLIGRDRLTKELTEHDFFGSCPQPADRIKLVATITGFDGNDPDDHFDWFREGRAIPQWFDEATGTVHTVKTNAGWDLCCQIALQAYFDHDSLSVEVVRYFHDHDNPFDPFAEDAPVGIPGKLISQLGFYMVRASRTWDRVFSWGSELFRRTLNAAAAQPSAAILAERDRLRQPQQPIERDPHITQLIENVNAEIARCFPSAPGIQLRVTGTDSKSVMEAVSAHFAVAEGPSIPAARQGSGIVSMQGLMLLLELGRARVEAGEGFLLALEEPELHLPPSAQQQLVQRVQALSTQTFITTHSPLIAASANPASVMVLRNDHGELASEPFQETPLQPQAQNWERRFFQHSRVDVLSALMQPTILIPEGKADFHLFRSILRPLMLTEGWSVTMPRAFGIEVGMVPTEDAKVVELYRAMSRIHRHVCCLVDGDHDGLRYIDSLLQEPSRPAAIIRWADGEMIEDVVGWILDADPDAILVALNELTNPAPQAISEIVNRLKDSKMDIVAYEAVADAIVSSPPCRVRAAELFGGLAAICVGGRSGRFASRDNGVWVFQP
ncbi:ATP-dependent nuclease [Ectopseudomonas oleovorans]|uniref:ATP-dependent nuclease n=1 Tax=Ectopseudomonas oleovorans TaxID=301 RepID=UPI000CF1029A|nr:AAA family ATPase [Pseudomonas oleovorans]PPV39495.1 chromosome partitioning protein [Pseudomonas oleovorans]